MEVIEIGSGGQVAPEPVYCSRSSRGDCRISPLRTTLMSAGENGKRPAIAGSATTFSMPS